MGHPCQHYLECGGCSFWKLPYELELKEKKESFLKNYSKSLGPLKKELSIIPSASSENYRIKAQLKWDGNSLGYHRAGSHKVEEIENCKVLFGPLNRMLPPIREYCKAKSLPASEFFLSTNHLGDILVKVLSEKLNKLPINMLEELPDEVKGLALFKNKGHLHRKTQQIGESSLVIEIGDLKYRIGIDSFFQINPAQLSKMISLIIEPIENKGHALGMDLYCGAATLTIPLSRHIKKVVGIEFNSESNDLGIENIKMNKAKGISLRFGDVKKELKELLSKKPQVICADPPRSGLHPDVISTISGFSSIERFIYVSCNPDTLIRDLAGLFQRGFELEKINLLDMFPRTKHLETVLVLRR